MTGNTRQFEQLLYVLWFDSPVGMMAACANEHAITGLEFTDDKTRADVSSALERRFNRSVTEDINPHLMLLEVELAGYFAGAVRKFDVPVEFSGTPFQCGVWRALHDVPYGETRTYQDIANGLGVPNATRAVGHANSQNRIAVVVPCHRVISSDGKLGGYAGGQWRKRHLLDLERGQRELLL